MDDATIPNENQDKFEISSVAHTFQKTIFTSSVGLDLKDFYYPRRKLAEVLDRLLQVKTPMGDDSVKPKAGTQGMAYALLGDYCTNLLGYGKIATVFIVPGGKSKEGGYMNVTQALRIAATSLVTHYAFHVFERGLHVVDEDHPLVKVVPASEMYENAANFLSQRQTTFPAACDVPIVWLMDLDAEEDYRNVFMRESKGKHSHTSAATFINTFLHYRATHFLPTIITSPNDLSAFGNEDKKYIFGSWLCRNAQGDPRKDWNNPGSERALFSKFLPVRLSPADNVREP